MNWWEYVVETAGTDSPKALHAKTGIDGPNFSKWKGGQIPGPQFVATFARSYGRPVLEAFVRAGFLTEAEANATPSAAPDLTKFKNDELLKLVRARMREEGEEHADRSAPMNPPPPTEGGTLHQLPVPPEDGLAVASGGTDDPDLARQASEQAAAARAKQEEAIAEMDKNLAEKQTDS